MLQVQVSIGRNTSPGIPLPKIAWYNFQRDIGEALWENVAGAAQWEEVHTGTGSWDGQTEESAHITVLDVFWLDREALTRDLASIAKRYGQDAIALTVTEPELLSRLDRLHGL